MTETSSDGARVTDAGVPGMSPYATGGGGVTLERRVAARYLVLLLTGASGAELDGRTVRRVSFQQSQRNVDDLMIRATRDGDTDPLELDVAVRRKPSFTTSDKDTQALCGDLLAAMRQSDAEEAERRLGICVAGPQSAAEQVSELTALARKQAGSDEFFALLRTPGTFKKALRERLQHLVNLVAANLSLDVSDRAAEAATWQLLCRLYILMPRFESPDETDWSELANKLKDWSRDGSMTTALKLRDRLESLCASYSPAAGNVDLTVLRRDSHELLHLERRHRAAAWAELRRLDAEARSVVRSTIGVGAGGDQVHLPRSGPASKVREQLGSSVAVLVSGDSGVGKSALVLAEVSKATTEDPAAFQIVYLNLRLLPNTMAELRGVLGAPIEELLGEVSAPKRVLVVDAADVVLEREGHLLAQLLRAATTAGVTPWVLSATDGSGVVGAVMKQNLDAIQELPIGGLNDEELDELGRAIPHLLRLLAEPRARELLRRPVVIDLLVRSKSDGLPLSEADAFKIVWTKLIRNDEQRNRGLPDAREQVMRQLAVQQIRQTDPADVLPSLDAAAVAGLRHDAVLRPADRWQSLPSFSHELLRTYAAAEALRSFRDIAAELIANGAPRWALPGMRLALQVLLSAPDSPASPFAGRFNRLQTETERISAAGNGDRWADVPTEAVLTLPNAREILADAWPALVRGDAVGLRRVLRVVDQRHGRGILDRYVAEPLVGLLLDHDWPSGLQDEVNKLLGGWLRSLVLLGEPAGNPLRIALRERLAKRVSDGEEREAQYRREQAARLAARTAEEVARDEDRKRAARSVMSLGSRSRRLRRWRELPRELTDKVLVEQLALLGSNLGDAGEGLLGRVAKDAPERLAPALEGLLTGPSLASHSAELLIQLAEAYYIDDRDDERYGGMDADGVRRHRPAGLDMPLAALYRGPFLAMFRADLRSGAAFLNRLLNHAARARVEVLRNLDRDHSPGWEERYVTELAISGERRRYYGDGHVWNWYRGSGVGPYPCISALQALEFVCDECVQSGVPLRVLVRLLLHECDNLAMPALVVGLLVRHLESAGDELDPYLAEPAIWKFEFARKVSETSSFAARASQTAGGERRGWDLRETAMYLTLTAGEDRREALKEVGRRLVARATDLAGGETGDDVPSIELAAVRAWASTFDRDTYSFTAVDEGVRVEQIVDGEVGAQLASSTVDLVRDQEAMMLMFRYPERYEHIVKRRPVTLEDLSADLATAFEFANDPPAGVPGGLYDTSAAVTAAAIEARFRDFLDVPEDDLVWAAGFLVRLVNDLADQGAAEDPYSAFGRGVGRSAARALPLLWLPDAGSVLERLFAEGVKVEAISRSIEWIGEHGADETRLFLARSFDPLWGTPCSTGERPCHHVVALSMIEDLARDVLIGPWDPAEQCGRRIRIGGAVAQRLLEAENERVSVPRLSAPIRGASAAAVSSACCHGDAAALLAAALTAHRRGMREHEDGYHHSSDDAAVAARAVIELAAAGDESQLFVQIDEYSRNPVLLSEFLEALVAAGEESGCRARTVGKLWPAVMDRVVELVDSGACPVDEREYAKTPLSSVIPTPSFESGYLHREYEGEPIRWSDPPALVPELERWLRPAAGSPACVDALAILLEQLPLEEQTKIGLPWMDQLVMANPDRIARRSFLLPKWLEHVRPHASSESLLAAWHRIVDALTVAGDGRVAALAD